MKGKKTLLVTFPVDLGNRTLESNLHAIFSEDMDYYRFAEKHAMENKSGSTTLSQSIRYRLYATMGLRNIVSRYTSQGKNILFHGISPALFSYGAWKPSQTTIVVDWTRGLYPSALGEPFKKNMLFDIHRKILSRCPRILCLTDAVMENLVDLYGVSRSSLYKVPMPFQVDLLDIPPRPTPVLPRVLFVGGDLKRKGGDVLLDVWKRDLAGKCSLTMMTNDKAANLDGINFLPGVRYGSDRHKKAFEENDIMILPTRIDGYPQVIGEAAAAGLAVITTKNALGAPEVILDGQSGYIADNPLECTERLANLLSHPHQIDTFKAAGYKLLHTKFSKKAIRDSYLEIVEGR